MFVIKTGNVVADFAREVVAGILHNKWNGHNLTAGNVQANNANNNK